MAEYTTSISRGKTAQRHNRRDCYNERNVPDNIDLSRVHENVVIIDRDIREVYDETFGAAVEEFNRKKVEAGYKNQVIPDYYEKIVADKQKQPMYEYVLQVGSMDDHPSAEESNEIYKDWLENFQERYGRNWVVKQAIIHHDEATPHMHVELVPVARDMRRGVSVQTSLNQAIKQSGFGDWKEMVDAWHTELDEALARAGHDKGESKHERHKHMTVEQYKGWVKGQEAIADAEAELEALEARRREAEQAHHDEMERMRERQAELTEQLQEAAESVALARAGVLEVEEERNGALNRLYEAQERLQKAESVAVAQEERADRAYKEAESAENGLWRRRYEKLRAAIENAIEHAPFGRALGKFLSSILPGKTNGAEAAHNLEVRESLTSQTGDRESARIRRPRL
jgi:hypothetical protein